MPTLLRHKINDTLDEGRILLLGSQILLGFQFIIFFSEVFGRLSRGLQLLHLVSLLLVCLTVILLITPAAFHRIVEDGEETERFHRVASRLVILATVPLAIATTLEFFIVAVEISGHTLLSTLLSVVLGLYFLTFWYG